MHFYFCFSIFLSLFCVALSITCKDENNNDIDWYIIYKLPKSDTNDVDIIRKGVAYVYADSNNIKWTYSQKSIAQNDNALAYTMEQLYQNQYSKDFLFLSYNDKTPHGKEHERMGHTKGVLMSNRTLGSWLVHSLPSFPEPASSSYTWPSNGVWNGQLFLCITFKYENIQNISQLIYFNTPFIHDKNIPDQFLINNNYLELIKRGSYCKTPPWNTSLSFASYDKGHLFEGFAKYKNFNADIYSDWLAPHYGSNLLAETWQKDDHALNSSCDKDLHVENVKGINFDLTNLKYTFSELIDHSKWAITVYLPEGTLNHVCMGDLNRALHQEQRSGGMVCIANNDIWALFKSIIDKVETCPKEIPNDVFRNSNHL